MGALIVMISYLIFLPIIGCTPEDDEPCIQTEDTVYTELGIPVHVDKKYCPDLELTDEIYLSVCECVGVYPVEFLGEFEIEIMDPIPDTGSKIIIGQYIFSNSRIKVTDDQSGLSHEIGHFFMHKLIGYKHFRPDSPNTYEILCDLEPP